MIIKIRDHKTFQNTLKNSHFLSLFDASKTYKNILEKLEHLKYVHSKSESILALATTQENKYEFVYVTNISSDAIHLDSISNKKIESLKFNNTTFDRYEIENIPFYTFQADQKLLISSSLHLLQKFSEKKSNGPTKTLQKLFDASSTKKAASFFINLNDGNDLFTTQLKTNSELNITGFSDWISLEMNEKLESLLLSGITIANDSTKNYIDLLSNTKPGSNVTPFFAPEHTDAILSYTFNDYNSFAKNRARYSNTTLTNDQFMETVEEIGLIYLKDETVVLLNTYGADGISEYLLQQKKQTIIYQGQELLVLNDSDFLNDRFSPLIENYSANFCVLIENAFIFAETESALKSVIRNYKSATTFNKTPIYTDLNKEIANESSILFLSNATYIKQSIQQHFLNDFAEDLNPKDFADYSFAAQTITDKNLHHTNIVIQKIKENNTSSNIISNDFQVDFNAQLLTNPQFVTNHSTGTKEIIVQDQNNILYLLSDKGKILWKKELSSTIQGRVTQVDIFKNGRLQMAFTTNNQLMVLDRNGNEVKKFTKTFEGGNLNQLAVFDYEKRKNYRFVVTQGKKTFMYDSQAKIVKGFKYTESAQAIIAPPKHIVIGNKDFLVFKLKDGSLKLLNRVGDVRIQVNEKIDFSENEVFKYKNKFVLTNKKGVLFQIDLNGKITKTDFNLSNDHGMAATNNTLVVMNDNILTIKGRPVELDLGVYTPPKIFYIRDKIYVSVTDLQSEKIYVFDSQAKPVQNFPIEGTSTIDLAAKKGKKSLALTTKAGESSLITYTVN